MRVSVRDMKWLGIVFYVDRRVDRNFSVIIISASFIGKVLAII